MQGKSGVKKPGLIALICSLSCVCCFARDDGVTGSPKIPQDNSLCLVCHLDFESEPLSADHLARKITCAACHGPSEAHQADETDMTKPDILFGRSEVVPFCKECHEDHKRPDLVEAFRTEWRGRIRPNGRTIQQKPMCTDCHGRHTILHR